MDDEQARTWLLLQQLPGLPRRVFFRLTQHYVDPRHILQLSDAELQAQGVKPAFLQARRQAPDAELEKRVEAGWRSLASLGASLLPCSADAYPDLLREIPDPPPLLSVCGDIGLLARPQLAIVGSRRCSHGAAETARSFASALAAAGMTITSGLALGIDAQAHRGALEAGGDTIAVLGAGLDVVYPRRHQSLYRRIAEQGLLVSEFAPGSPPLPAQFPQRNRVISGLSLGVLVVEAVLRSGSLVTARHAMEQNREVFALPGSIHHPGSRGCHALIRQGAKLVESVTDIFEEFGGWLQPVSSPAVSEAPSAGADTPLMRILGFEPMPLDILLAHTGESIARLQAELVDLQLQGLVEQTAAGWQRCR